MAGDGSEVWGLTNRSAQIIDPQRAQSFVDLQEVAVPV